MATRYCVPRCALACLAVVGCGLSVVATANAQPYTVGKTSGFTIRAFDLHGSAGVDDELNTAAETLGIWNANPTTTGNIGANATTYNIEAYETGTVASIDYVAGGDFGVNRPLNTIGSGTIPAAGSQDISVRALAYLAIPAGQWSIAIASDDGRRMEIFDAQNGLIGPGGVNGFASGFTSKGDQQDIAGANVLGFNGTTGHNQSAATFTITQGTHTEAGTNLALLFLDAFYFERGTGGGSFEISIRPGLDNTWDSTAEGWQLLSDNTYGWHVSTTPITLSLINPVNSFTWEAGAVDDWRAGIGANTRWELPTTNPLIVTSADDGTINSGTVNVTNAEEALNLHHNGGTVNVNGAGSLNIVGSHTMGAGAVLNINSTYTAFIHSGDAASTINLGNGSTMNITSVSTVGDINVVGTATINASALAADSLNINGATLNKVGGGYLVINNTTTVGGTLNNNDSSTISLLGQVTGAGGLIKSGNGALVFDNAANNNNFTGVLALNGPSVIDVTRSNDLGATGVGNETTVTGGGTIRFGGPAGFTTNESFTINGAGTGVNNGALYNLSQDHNIGGLVTLGSASQIRVDNNTLRLQGGVALGANNLTWEIDGATVGEINTAAITGSGQLIKNGDGTLQIRVDSPTYSGNIVINNGVLDLDNRPTGLGNTTGNTTVVGGAGGGGTLRLGGSVTTAENIVLNGTGEAAILGALRSENGANVITGTVNVATNSLVHVNATSLQLSGVVSTGAGAVIGKNGAGRLILSNAGNSFGNLEINAGVVEARNNGALGATGANAITINHSGALELNGAAAGDFASLNKTIALTGSGTISNASVASPVTISSPISLTPNADVTFGGAGNMLVTQAFGNGLVTAQNGLIAHRYFNAGGTGPVTFDGAYSAGADGSIIGTGAINGNPAMVGIQTGSLSYTSNLSWNPLFGSAGDGDQSNFQTVWMGTFTPTHTGTYQFGVSGGNAGGDIDDDGSFYVDSNNNGTFEASERVVTSTNATHTTPVSLTAGVSYQIAIAFSEGGGGETFSAFGLNGPAGSAFAGGTRILINPSAAAQTGLFSFDADNDVTKTGAGTVTFAGANTYDGSTTINGGTLVAAHSTALGIADGTPKTGTTIAGGATLALGGPNASGPVNIGNERLTITGSGATIANAGGNNSIASQNITVQGSGFSPDSHVNLSSGGATDQMRIGAAGGTFALGTAQLRANGLGQTTIESDITATSINTTVANLTNGLRAARYTGTRALADLDFGTAGAYVMNSDGTISQGSLLLATNPAQLGVMNFAMSFDDDSANVTPQAGNVTHHFEAMFGDLGAQDQSNYQIAWSGFFKPTADGNFTFTSHDFGFTGTDVDDDAAVFIDINRNGIFDGATEGFFSGTGTSFTAVGLDSDLYYPILFAHREGTGDDELSFTFSGGGFAALTPINPSLAAQTGVFSFGTIQTSPGVYHVVKNDAGLLRLNGLLQYNGATQVNDGTITVNADNVASGTPQGNWEINGDSTLGGNGSINLASGAQVLVAPTGFVSPGDALHKNPSTSWAGNPTFSAGATGDTVGTLTISQADPLAPGVPALDMSGATLQIDIVDPATYDVLQALNGQIDITNAVLNINGKDGSVSNPYEDIDFASIMGDNGSAMFTILSASDGVLGNFVNFPGATFLDASGEFYVTFGQDENSVFISLLQTPEPATIVLWSALGALGMVFAWRQRKRVR